MENLNVVDLAAIAIILVSTILAYFRGLSREILAIVSWVIAALMGFIIAPYLDPFINKIPIIKEILMDSCELSIMISYIVGFLLSLIFLSLLIPILTNIIHQSNLNWTRQATRPLLWGFTWFINNNRLNNCLRPLFYRQQEFTTGRVISNE